MLREACFVSLFFFLRYICSATGPFERLNDDLHMQMCNVRQSWSVPGLWGAAFLPRGFYKTTIFTIGGAAWDAVRDPNIRIKLVNAIFERSMGFMHTWQRIFDSNPLIAWLLPEYTPSKNSPRWNDKEAVLPNRTRHYTEPTLKCAAVGGANEGDHPDVFSLDDLVGLQALNSANQSSAVMESTSQWLRTSIRTELDWNTGRIVLAATRYAIDDTYSIPWKDCREFIGCSMEPIVLKETNKWIIYNRLVEEHGVLINPEATDAETLAKLKAEDPWTAATQFYNSPQLSGLTEFTQLPNNIATMRWDEFRQDWIIERPDEKKGVVERRLSRCDVRMGVDPAATERGITSKTSRSAVAVTAMDEDAYIYSIYNRTGFVSLEALYDWIFAAQEKFKGMIAECVFESNAFQKILKRELEKERERREVYIYFTPKAVLSDKDARIRARIGPLLTREKLWFIEGEHNEPIAEKQVFPQSRMKDLLDAMEKAISAHHRPVSAHDEVAAQMSDAYFEEERSNVSGY